VLSVESPTRRYRRRAFKAVTAGIALVALGDDCAPTIEETGVNSVGAVPDRVCSAGRRAIPPVPDGLLGESLERVDNGVGRFDNSRTLALAILARAGTSSHFCAGRVAVRGARARDTAFPSLGAGRQRRLDALVLSVVAEYEGLADG